MSRSRSATADDIDVTSLAGGLKRALPRLMLATVAAGALAFLTLSTLPSRYTSEAQLIIGGRGLTDPFRSPKVGEQPTAEAVTVKVDREAVASQVLAIRSRDLAVRLAKELQLARHPEFNSALPPPDVAGRLMRLAGLAGPRAGETEEDRVLSAYYQALKVYQGKDTRVIMIEMTSQSPELAARAANRLAELYQDWLRSQGVSQTAGASEWLKPQIEALSVEVREAEAAVERFRSEANLFRAGRENTGLNEQQLADLAAEHTRAQSARSEAEARARSARELLTRNRVDAIPDLQRSPVIQGLIAQRVRAEREKAEAESLLLPGHPRMKQLVANLADLRKQIQREAQSLVEGLEREAKLALQREEGAKRLLDEAKTRVGATSADVAKLSALEGAAKAKRRELEALQASFEATRTRGDARSVPLEAQLLSRARPSSVPVFPRKGPLSALAAAATFVLGLAFVITRELIAGGRGTAPAHGNAAERRYGRRADDRAPRVEVTPPVRTAAAPNPPQPVSGEPRRFAAFNSAADIARHLAERPAAATGHRTLMIVDRGGEDTAEIRALADALTAAGRQTVIVDWAPRGRGQGLASGAAEAAGVNDLLAGRASFEDVIGRLPESEAHLVGTGRAADDGEPLDADRINLVLDALDEAYDNIVVVANADDGRELFGAIEGRFDAGVLIGGGRRQSVLATAAPGTFLGYEVTDIDIIRLERASASSMPSRKMQLARRKATA